MAIVKKGNTPNSDILKLKIRHSLTGYTSGTLDDFWENNTNLSYIHRL